MSAIAAIGIAQLATGPQKCYINRDPINTCFQNQFNTLTVLSQESNSAFNVCSEWGWRGG